ncbi:DUF2975 domain-containing protein [Proteinivorax hydrogeniformans]|uniref:DUF2975 domain-containing protein n=1 Tax=Proteinivorax hydrogeniformans TaxID=1826727 RepID=A0AAU8HVQ1_9FIRM
MRHALAAKTLKLLLTALWVVGITSFLATILIGVVSINELDSMKNIVGIIFFILGHVIVLAIIWELRKIIKTVLEKEPFTQSNIRGFNLIGLLTLTMAVLTFFRDVFYVIEGYPDLSILQYFGSDGFQTRMGFFMFLIFGCLAFVLSEIFRVAKKIKEENDLTV